MAVGVGLCALVLLALASAGPTLDRLADRSAARTPAIGADGEGFAYRTIDTTVNGHVIRGRLLQAVPAGSAQPAPPPGADHYPAPGETIVSPRLAELLQTARGADPARRAGHPRFRRPGGPASADGCTGPAEVGLHPGSPLSATTRSWCRAPRPSTPEPMDPANLDDPAPPPAHGPAVPLHRAGRRGWAAPGGNAGCGAPPALRVPAFAVRRPWGPAARLRRRGACGPCCSCGRPSPALTSPDTR